MSNNKQSIKLYTEEEVREALRLCEKSVCGNFPILSEDDILEELTPIELPSDEEIEKFAFDTYHIYGEARWFKPLKIGAKWMRDKIGGNK